MSGIVKRYGFKTVHDFYRAYTAAKTTYANYQNKADKWDKFYGTKAQNDTMQEKIQNLQRKTKQKKRANITVKR